MTQVHFFSSSRDAYDACQCDSSIEDSDFLVVVNEKVLGVAGTWPWAISDNAGELHVNSNQTSVNAARAKAAKMKLFDLIEEPS